MFESIKRFVMGLIYENEAPSLTRVIAIVSYASFLAGSFFLLLTGKTWVNYETFAALTAGSGSALQMLNKFVNSKYNSPSEQFPEKGGLGSGTDKSQDN